MDTRELERNGEIKRKTIEPRKDCVPTGFVFTPHGSKKAARRAAYFAGRGMV